MNNRLHKPSLIRMGFLAGLESAELLFHRLGQMIARTLGPLRKIVTRSINVLSWDRIHPDKPASFILNDELECGHVHPLLGLDIFDLLNAYTDNPGMTAKRHRCLPCLRLVGRKPMASVTAVNPKAGVA